jgi:hypothetical protein
VKEADDRVKTLRTAAKNTEKQNKAAFGQRHLGKGKPCQKGATQKGMECFRGPWRWKGQIRKKTEGRS